MYLQEIIKSPRFLSHFAHIFVLFRPKFDVPELCGNESDANYATHKAFSDLWSRHVRFTDVYCAKKVLLHDFK